jgi:hypothetical protein
MFRFWVRKEKRKRELYVTPDIARVTPYSPTECINRLNQFVSKQNRHSNTQLVTEKAEDVPDEWHFAISKSFMNEETIGHGRGRTRLCISGVLMKWGPNDYTRVRARVSSTNHTYFLWIGSILVAGILLIWMYYSGIPTNAFLISSFTICAIFTLLIYQSFNTIKVTKARFVDEVKEILHKEDGSIE